MNTHTAAGIAGRGLLVRRFETLHGVRYFLADWFIVAFYLLIFGFVAILVVCWSARIDWGAAHRLALAGGALLTYAWHAFPQKPVIGSTGAIDLVGNTVFALLLVALLLVAYRAVSSLQSCRDTGHVGPSLGPLC